eukprot:CAMPEP_0184308294 /NCGR_PEP_ID=MMETSP1049-20130417/16783_1 /TAXON_ID=77928 /ORGANISM="Proteomonas sulcata, Strain CCMP704" /LENGTH=321 /DNA_ID=CAMNT_0026620945 /DNA_START=33 /DNA_END=998 /DNA_ORIENTATION=+
MVRTQRLIMQSRRSLQQWCLRQAVTIASAAFFPLALGRSQSHDPTLAAHLLNDQPPGFVHSNLPKPLAGLERIAKNGGTCRKGHGALPCRNRGRSITAPRDQTGSFNKDRRHRVRGISARMSGSGPSKGYSIVEENKAWESSFGALTIYERVVEHPDDDPNPSAEDGEAGGTPDGGMPLITKPAVRSDNKRKLRWHVWGSPMCNFTSVVIFPYDSRTDTCSLIHEFSPGVGKRTLSIPGGMFEASKHRDILHAAKDELNEEAGLMGGTWYPLSVDGIPQDKYSLNLLYPFLVVDSNIDPHPKPLDAEEDITVEHGIQIEEV